MDKTYNDLMSIVNRTKTIQGDDSPKITRRIRREEPIDEAVESARVVKPAKDLDESKPSLFAGSDAITKYLANSKKKTTKTTAKKSENKESSEKEEKKGKKTTTKAPVKKTTAKKAPAKKETPKVEKPKVEKVEKTIPAKKVETPEIDLSNPENAQLYNALKGTLLAGGTDISEYIDNDKEETEGILKTLQEKRKAEKINEEITKEQQEYERLFTGSFYSEEEIKQDDQSSEEIEESHEETHEQENKENQEKPSRNIEDIAKDFEKIKVREEENEKDLEIDRKIAEYYKQKQEKINQYNENLYNGETIEEKTSSNSYEDRQQDYADIFSGEMVSRKSLMGEPEELEEVQEPEIEESQVEESESEEQEVQESQEENIKDSQVAIEEIETNPQISEIESKEIEDNSNITEFRALYNSLNGNEDASNSIVTPNEETIESSNSVDDEKEEIEESEITTEETIDLNAQESTDSQEENEDIDSEIEDTEEIEETHVEEKLFNPFDFSNLMNTIDKRVKEESEEIENSLDSEDLSEDSVEIEDSQEVKEQQEEVVSEIEEIAEPVEILEETKTIEESVVEGSELTEETEEETLEESEIEDSLEIEESEEVEEEVQEPEIEESQVEESESELEENLPEEPVIDEQTDLNNASAFVESVEESIYGEDDYSDYDDDELDRIDRPSKPYRPEEDDFDKIYSLEEEKQEEDIYDMSEDSELDDYIVSSSIPVEEESSEVQQTVQESEDDNSLVIDTQTLPEIQIEVFAEDNKDASEENQPKEEVKPEEKDVISKEEFYNEMARLQENLINELKGQKVEEAPVRDFFEEKVQEDTQLKNSTLNKALDIINNLTQPVEVATETQEVEEVGVAENQQPISTVESIEENEKEIDVQESIEEPSEPEIEQITVQEEQPIEENIETPSNENFDDIDLLQKDVALNEEDLEYFDNSIKPKDIENNCFYMSDEDKSKKAEFEDEYLTVYDESVGIVKEVGDINLNKDIRNAVPFSQLFRQPEEESNEVTDEEMETIYTLFGMERMKMEKPKEDIKVLYVASECQPFIATGGLADVAGSLPKEIAKIGGIDIRVIMPLYGNIKSEYRDKFEYLGNFTVHLSWRQEYCGLFKYFKDGVTYYFIDNERYFKREKTYGYYDDGERFAYFCKAIVESLPMLNYFPDIIHCNDWQSSLVSAYIKTGNWSDFRYYQIKNIYTIHNVEYQGVYGMENLKDLFGIDMRFRNDMDYNGDINLTKAAIQYSDKFTTVSESYCDNLKQPYCSRGLHHIIIRNEYKLSGIINGIDYDFYNPETDKVIYKNYNVDSIKDKVMNKKIWQEELGLPVDARTPMLAIVSRLVSHKGLDLVTKMIEDVLQQDIQLVVVGTGDQRFVDYYKYLEGKYPTKVRAMVDAFSNDLARKAYAASDIFIMPSKIEPCGISQMIASRYGSIPVVREVGGLKDSIKDFGCPQGGNGYTFTNYNPNDLKHQVNKAIEDYQDQVNWEKKMKIAMTTDFRWAKSAQKYIDLYKSLIK